MDPIWEGSDSFFTVDGDINALVGKDIIDMWRNKLYEDQGPAERWERVNNLSGLDWINSPPKTEIWGSVRVESIRSLCGVILSGDDSAWSAMSQHIDSERNAVICIELIRQGIQATQLMDTADIEALVIEIPDSQPLQGNNASGALLQQIMAKCEDMEPVISYTPPRNGGFLEFLENVMKLDIVFGVKSKSQDKSLASGALSMLMKPIKTYAMYGAAALAAFGFVALPTLNSLKNSVDKVDSINKAMNSDSGAADIKSQSRVTEDAKQADLLSGEGPPVSTQLVTWNRQMRESQALTNFLGSNYVVVEKTSDVMNVLVPKIMEQSILSVQSPFGPEQFTSLQGNIQAILSAPTHHPREFIERFVLSMAALSRGQKDGVVQYSNNRDWQHQLGNALGVLVGTLAADFNGQSMWEHFLLAHAFSQQDAIKIHILNDNGYTEAGTLRNILRKNTTVTAKSDISQGITFFQDVADQYAPSLDLIGGVLVVGADAVVAITEGDVGNQIVLAGDIMTSTISETADLMNNQPAVSGVGNRMYDRMNAIIPADLKQIGSYIAEAWGVISDAPEEERMTRYEYIISTGIAPAVMLVGGVGACPPAIMFLSAANAVALGFHVLRVNDDTVSNMGAYVTDTTGVSITNTEMKAYVRGAEILAHSAPLLNSVARALPTAAVAGKNMLMGQAVSLSTEAATGATANRALQALISRGGVVTRGMMRKVATEHGMDAETLTKLYGAFVETLTIEEAAAATVAYKTLEKAFAVAKKPENIRKAGEVSRAVAKTMQAYADSPLISASAVAFSTNEFWRNEEVVAIALNAGYFTDVTQCVINNSTGKLIVGGKGSLVSSGLLGCSAFTWNATAHGVVSEFAPNEDVETVDFLEKVATYMTRSTERKEHRNIISFVGAEVEMIATTLWSTGAIPGSADNNGVLPEFLPYDSMLELLRMMSSATILGPTRLTGVNSSFEVEPYSETVVSEDFARVHNERHIGSFVDYSTNPLLETPASLSVTGTFGDADGSIHRFVEGESLDVLESEITLPAGDRLSELGMRVAAMYMPLSISSIEGVSIPEKLLETNDFNRIYDSALYSIHKVNERVSFDSVLLEWVQEITGTNDTDGLNFKLSKALSLAYGGDIEAIKDAVQREESNTINDRLNNGDTKARLNTTPLIPDMLDKMQGESSAHIIDALTSVHPVAVRRAIMFSDRTVKSLAQTLDRALKSKSIINEKYIVTRPPIAQPDAAAIHRAKLQTRKNSLLAARSTASASLEIDSSIASITVMPSVMYNALGLILDTRLSEQIQALEGNADISDAEVKVRNAIAVNNELYKAWSGMVLDLWSDNISGGFVTMPSDEMKLMAEQWAGAIDHPDITADSLLVFATVSSVRQGQLSFRNKRSIEKMQDTFNSIQIGERITSGAPGLFEAIKHSLQQTQLMSKGNITEADRWQADQMIERAKSQNDTSAATVLLAELFSLTENSYMESLEKVEQVHGVAATAKASYMLNAALQYSGAIAEVTGDEEMTLGAVYDYGKRIQASESHSRYWSLLTSKGAVIDKDVGKDLLDFVQLVPYGGAIGMLDAALSTNATEQKLLYSTIKKRDEYIKNINVVTKYLMEASQGSDNTEIGDFIDDEIPSPAEYNVAIENLRPQMSMSAGKIFSDRKTTQELAKTVLRYSLDQKNKIDEQLNARSVDATLQAQSVFGSIALLVSGFTGAS